MLHLAVPLLLAAGLPGVSTQPKTRVLEFSLEEHACPDALQPWADPSSAWWFATGPTSRLDSTELHAGVLAPLVSFGLWRDAVRFFVLGAPLRASVEFTHLGWRARWPFC